MDREVLDKWLERGILGLVLTILLFAPLGMGAVRPTEFLVVQGLTVLIGIVWMLRLWVSPEPKLFWPPISWAVLAFLLYGVARYFTSEIEYVARQELIRVAVYAILFFAITNNIKRPEASQIIVVGLIVVATAIAAYGAFQFLTKSTFVWSFTRPVQYLSRGSGTFINPNHFSGFLEMVLPLAIALTLLGRFKHVTKIFLGYAGLIILVGIGFSISRGGWVATGIILLGMVVMLMQQRGSRLKAAVVFALLIVVGVTFLNTSWFQKRMEQSSGSGKLEDIRPRLWESAVNLWKEDPWIGVGLAHFDQRYGKYRQADWRVQGRPIYVHNDYLNALTEWGIIGVSLISAALGLLVYGFFRTWSVLQKGQSDLNRKRSNREAILIGSIFGVFAMLLHSVVDFNLQVPGNAMLFVALMAIITGLRRYESKPFSFSASFPSRALISLILLTGIMALSLQGIRRFEEQKWLRLAEKLTSKPTERLAALKRAHDAEPQNFETTYRIGELVRAESWKANPNYKEEAFEAMNWFLRGMKLNPFSAYNYLRYGMCLDWIGEHEKAGAYFDKALAVEPNSYFVASHMGWHYMQVEDYERAKQWFTRSWQLLDNFMNRNPMPGIYLDIIQRRQTEVPTEPVFNIPPSS